MLFVSLLCCVLLSTDELSALGEAELLQRAEAAFQEGSRLRDSPTQARPAFARAATLYRELRRRGVRNVDLDRNTGRAALLGHNLPAAILAFRQGLRLSPHDAELCED